MDEKTSSQVSSRIPNLSEILQKAANILDDPWVAMPEDWFGG
jgi:hypothetical protein